MKLSHLFNLFSLIALISLSLSGVAFGAKKPIIREDVRYSWDHKIALHELGFIEASKAIPCPCIWNNPKKKGSQEYKGRTWECTGRDKNGECVFVSIKK